MHLQGQHAGGTSERGYAMAALLVALGVMAVLMSAVLPAWRHQARREKEAELVFRGEQYVRAISLWERKMGPGSRPPNIDILVQQRFLRKKYKDPMTEDGEFQPLYVGANLQATSPDGRGRSGQPPQSQPPTSRGAQVGAGGIFGVASKSKEASIRLYRGRGHYNEWQFLHAGAASGPGGPGRGTPGGPGRSGPGFPGGPGTGPARGGPGGRGPGAGPGGRGIGPGLEPPQPMGPGRGRQ
jgi:type II secretory pathway pseudopilin PulG